MSSTHLGCHSNTRKINWVTRDLLYVLLALILTVFGSRNVRGEARKHLYPFSAPRLDNKKISSRLALALGAGPAASATGSSFSNVKGRLDYPGLGRRAKPDGECRFTHPTDHRESATHGTR